MNEDLLCDRHRAMNLLTFSFNVYTSWEQRIHILDKAFLLLLMQVRVPDTQWGQTTETSEFGAESGLLQGHARIRGFHVFTWAFQAHALKSLELPKGFRQSERAGRRVWDQPVRNSLIGWWWGYRTVSQGLTLSVLRLQETWGYAQGHQVVLPFGGDSFHICKTQEMCIKYYYLGTSERS